MNTFPKRRHDEDSVFGRQNCSTLTGSITLKTIEYERSIVHKSILKMVSGKYVILCKRLWFGLERVPNDFRL